MHPSGDRHMCRSRGSAHVPTSFNIATRFARSGCSRAGGSRPARRPRAGRAVELVLGEDGARSPARDRCRATPAPTWMFAGLVWRYSASSGCGDAYGMLIGVQTRPVRGDERDEVVGDPLLRRQRLVARLRAVEGLVEARHLPGDPPSTASALSAPPRASHGRRGAACASRAAPAPRRRRGSPRSGTRSGPGSAARRRRGSRTRRPRRRPSRRRAAPASAPARATSEAAERARDEAVRPEHLADPARAVVGDVEDPGRASELVRGVRVLVSDHSGGR